MEELKRQMRRLDYATYNAIVWKAEGLDYNTAYKAICKELRYMLISYFTDKKAKVNVKKLNAFIKKINNFDLELLCEYYCDYVGDLSDWLFRNY